MKTSLVLPSFAVVLPSLGFPSLSRGKIESGSGEGKVNKRDGQEEKL